MFLNLSYLTTRIGRGSQDLVPDGSLGAPPSRYASGSPALKFGTGEDIVNPSFNFGTGEIQPRMTWGEEA